MRVLGFEPRTSALSELRSSQLSYTRLSFGRGFVRRTAENGPWLFLPVKREGQTVSGLAPSDKPVVSESYPRLGGIRAVSDEGVVMHTSWGGMAHREF